MKNSAFDIKNNSDAEILHIMVSLESEHITLREFKMEDFDAVHSYAGDPEVVKFLSWGPNSVFETQRFLQRSINSQIVKPRTSYELGIIFHDQLVGGCGLTIHSLVDKRAEIGYCIRSDHWGKGIGTRVAAMLIEFGFKSLDLHRIEAKCDPNNHASYRIMENNGMLREGILREEKNIHGKWRDSYIYSILRRDWHE